MKIGYPCINRKIGCTSNSTFRLASYSEERLVRTIKSNLDCLQKILMYNVQNGILFFRISSEIVPFASHPICNFDWQDHFKKDFFEIGKFIKKSDIRISMHPDQFVLINSPKENIVQKSIDELEYHCDVLDLMRLDKTAKIQIHVGGVYGDKENSTKRFIQNYHLLDQKIKKRLCIENDERLFSLADCLKISESIGIPVIFDTLHHSFFNNGESLSEAIVLSQKTWKKSDGLLMVDYSSQQEASRNGKHASTIDLRDFRKFLEETRGMDFDVMLEIKDKEKSALKAVKIFNQISGKKI